MMCAWTCGTAIVLASGGAAAQQAPDLEEVVVRDRWDNPVGYSVSASEGVVGAEEIDARPRLRTGEILEVVPGLIMTQHSGTGKSNQMFLRGFNLDHGTDFATWVDGMPVNMPSHGHGQGYTDLNFLIPELVERLEYRKGAYYAEVSDFSSAGGAYLSTYDRLERGIIEAGYGESGYRRALAADSVAAGGGELLYAAQAHYYDGPWDIGEDLQRYNGQLRYAHRGSSGGEWNASLMAYDARWNAADQIPRRAVESGSISMLGALDPDLGGSTSRYSLSGGWSGKLGAASVRANAYLIDYDLELFSNFTYFLDDPENGDEFEQLDDRLVSGGELKLAFGRIETGEHTFGANFRHDDIRAVGLFRTVSRQRVSTVRRDAVDQLTLGAFYAHQKQWTDRWRTTLGVRADLYDFEVESGLPANSGTADDTMISPKANLVYSLSDTTELYVSAGVGFHSNDARGTTITVDPATGDPVEQVDPLVEAREVEIGFRAFADRRMNVSASLWYLELDSELLFVGDAGTTEASRPSRRYGLEVPLYYRPNDNWTFDVELALTRSAFTRFDPAGSQIPGSIDRVVAAGASVRYPSGFYGSLRLRHFGPRPLIEDGSVESDASTVLNLSAGIERGDYEFRLDVLNLLDSNDDDISYFYASRLPGEITAGIEDIHFHPMEPRTMRLHARWRF